MYKYKMADVDDHNSDDDVQDVTESNIIQAYEPGRAELLTELGPLLDCAADRAILMRYARFIASSRYPLKKEDKLMWPLVNGGEVEVEQHTLNGETYTFMRYCPLLIFQGDTEHTGAVIEFNQTVLVRNREIRYWRDAHGAKHLYPLYNTEFKYGTACIHVPTCTHANSRAN